MRLAMVGLGRMGANMARRLVRGGHEVVAYDRDAGVADALRAEDERIVPAADLDGLVAALPAPRVVWMMLPAGPPTNDTVRRLVGMLDAGDVIVNGANSRWTDSQALAAEAVGEGTVVLDAGVSGGVWGLDAGYCLMVGGDAGACERLATVFASLVTPGGYARVGDAGAGHYAKMVHNGIEYGMMQAFGEGFELLEASEFDYDLAAVAEVWRHGSVVRSWLLDLAAELFAEEGGLADVAPYVEDSGEGRWTVEAAIDARVPTPVIAAALFTRFSSRRDLFSDRVVAGLRERFGGHTVRSLGESRGGPT